MERAVRFEDCHEGDVFRIDKDSPWLNRFDFVDIGIKTLKAKIDCVDIGDYSIHILVYVNKEQQPRFTGWLYALTPEPSARIDNNLRFLAKKNNYW